MPKIGAKHWLIIVAVAVFAGSLSFTAALAQNNDQPKITFDSPDDTVVAVVNGEEITKSQLEEALWMRFAVATLTDIIDKVSVRQAAESEGVTLTDADLDEKVDELKQRLPPGMTYEDFLQQYNMTEEQLRNELATNAYIEKAAGAGINVTDQDLAGYVRARHILISTQGPGMTPENRETTEEEAKAKLEGIAERIKAGEITFEDAAREYSDDPGSKNLGGDLGFFKRGVMLKEFEDVAFDLAPGEISEPVKTAFGYHLIMVEELGRDATGEQRAELIENIRQERLRPEMSAWYMRVRQNAQVERALGEQPPPPAPVEPVEPVSETPPMPEGMEGHDAPPPPPPPAP